MKGAQLKAILMIVLIFGGIGWFLFGDLNLEWPDLSGIKKWFKTEKVSKPQKRAKSASAGVGKIIDNYRGVPVYYNGNVTHVSGRNTTKSGYNLGLKYQCVEFAKRFYYEVYKHEMPDSYGHAKDFFDGSLAHGSYNKSRGMVQFRNGGPEKPRANDLVVIGASGGNRYGHLFVVTKVSGNNLEFIQQNPGIGNPSRGRYKLKSRNGNWFIETNQVSGWLRIQ